MASAFVDLVGETGSLNFEPHRVAPDLDQNDDSWPDVTIYDAAEKPRVLVEAAFWEGVPAAQPVDYLCKLSRRPAFGPGVHRTAKADSVPVGDPARALCGRSGNRSRGRTPDGRSGPGAGRRPCPPGCELGVRARDPAANHRGSGRRAGQIVQLRSLTKRMETAAFLPLEEDEAADAAVARRMLCYRGLVDKIARRLETEGLATNVKVPPAFLPEAARRGLGHAAARQVRAAFRGRARRLARFRAHARCGVS